MKLEALPRETVLREGSLDILQGFPPLSSPQFTIIVMGEISLLFPLRDPIVSPFLWLGLLFTLHKSRYTLHFN